MKTKIHYNAAHAGYGKTDYIIKNMIKNITNNPRSFQLYVGVSIDNIKEKAETFENILSDCNVYCFYKKDDKSVALTIMDTIVDINENNYENNVFTMSYAAYTILKQWGILDNLIYDVYFDEEPPVLQTTSLTVGNTTLQNIVSKLNETKVSVNFSILDTNSISFFDSILKQKDSMTLPIRNLSNALVNIDYFAVYSKFNDIQKYLSGQSFYDNNMDIRILTNEKMFIGARNTYITAAQFEFTLFYSIFKTKINFIDDTENGARYHTNGHRLNINYYHKENISRNRNDTVDPITGNKNVDNLCNYITDSIPEKKIAYTNNYRLKSQRKFCSSNTFLTNTNVVGMNHLTDYNNSICLATLNPSSDDTSFAKEILDMEYDELLRTRLYTIYQCMFRDSMRDTSSEELVNWHVLDLQTAEYLTMFFTENKPTLNYVENDIYYNKKLNISNEAIEAKNILIKNAVRKQNKNTYVYKDFTKIKFDNNNNVIFDMVESNNTYTFTENETNFLIFSVENSNINTVVDKLTKLDITYYIQQSKIGKKQAKLIIPVDKTLSCDMYDIMCEYISDYIFGNNTIKPLNINSTIYTKNVSKQYHIGQLFSTREILKSKQFRNFVSYFIQSTIDEDKNDIFVLYDFINVANKSNMQRIVNNIKKITGLNEINVINKILTSKTKLQQVRLKSLL